MKLPHISDLNITGKRVIVRFDGDVPTDDGGREILDDYRLKAVLPTIKHCLIHEAKIILMAHRGRPDRASDPTLSNKIVADYFSHVLGEPVAFVPDLRATRVEDCVAVLENLRFHKGEERNNPHFAKQLAAFGDFYCNDAFAVSHRAHASIVGVPELLPHAAGFQLADEIKHLTTLNDDIESPYVVVLGGAKASDKSPILADLGDKANVILLGGLVAVVYLAALGQSVGAHKLDSKDIKEAQHCIHILNRHRVQLLVPIDFITQNNETKRTQDIAQDDLILDIGPKTQGLYATALKKANSIFWNGAMGKFEEPAYARGTIATGHAIAASDAVQRITSGGDTVSAIHEHHMAKGFTFISTGGGATLEFIAGRELPGIAALES